MAHSHSSEDSDSSPSAFRSSSRDNTLAISGGMLPVDPNTDPESPNAAQQSSDESGSSDGVLVDLPGNNDQDSRSMPGDPENGILVNIDGSMQEQQEREDLFLDASDHLGSGGRTPRLGQSVAEVETADATRRRRSREQDLERNQARLDATAAECSKYKEERVAFGREVVALCAELQVLIDQPFMNSQKPVEYHRLLENRELGHDILASPTSLHSIVKDCTQFVVHLKGILYERLNSDSALLNAKDQEMDALNRKILEDDMFQDVLMSYLGSVRRECSLSMHEYLNVIGRRLLASLPVMNETETTPSEELFVDGISLIEKRTMLLVEKHNLLLLEIEQLGQLMEEVKPGSLNAQKNDLNLIFALARKELLQSKKKEGELEGKIQVLEGKIQVLEEENMNLVEQITGLNEANKELDFETSKIKTDLEQAENKFLAAKEKLSIAVTKGKQLVQHRDSLKQSLTDKTIELDKCVQELQQKANTLEMMEASNEELQQLLSVKTSELEKCSLELQDKSSILGRNEAIIEDLKQLLQEKTTELEKCLQELLLKTDAFVYAKADSEELRQLLSENKDQLENCLLELQQKSKELETTVANSEELNQSFTEKIYELEECLLNLKQKKDALETAEANVQQLKQALSEKDIELEKTLLELQEKSDLIETKFKEFNELQKLVLSSQDLVAYRDKALKEIEEITHDIDFPQELISLDFVDKLKWLVTKIHTSDDILKENLRVKDALFSVGVPLAIASAKLDFQVDWLVRSFNQSKVELSRLQNEVTHTLTLHKSEVSEALKEVDRLAESLLKEKEGKESLLAEYENLKVNHEKLAENLALISSEKERFFEFLKDIFATCLGDQLTPDMDTMLEKSIFYFRQKLKISLIDGKRLERMQDFLHVTHVERILYEKILEEELVNGSKLISLSNELGIASEEINALRNEKESIKKEVERLEERNSLLRDKLSMAVKKGKGLVQEREVFKLTLDEKKTEIEKLKEELQLQESKVCEYMEQIKSLSAYPEQLLKLEVDIASLKDKRELSEHLLSERNDKLQKLVDSINNITLHIDKVFESPIEKVNWIAGCINEAEIAQACLAKELEKEKDDANLNSSRLTETLNTIVFLEKELEDKDKYIHDILEEIKDIQVIKAKTEDELAKVREESFLQANKLVDTHATIKSLEDNFLLAEDKVFALVAEKNEVIFKSNLEISALNAKIEESMEELVKTQDSSESQLTELLSELRQLEIFMKNEGLFPLMIEHFSKKAEGLKHMWMLIQDIHEKLLAKEPNIHPEMEHVLSNLSSSTNFEDLTKNENFHSEAILDEAGAVTSCKRIVENIYKGTRFLNDKFKGLSRYMDDHITYTLQALEASRDEFIRTLDLSEFLKLNIAKLEEQNQAQEFEISSLQTEALMLLSKCNDATVELQDKISDLGIDSCLENVQIGLHLRPPASFHDKAEKVDVSEFSQTADILLLTCRKITIQYENLLKINKERLISLENLKTKLNHAETTAAITLDEKKLIQERVLKLEGDMEALQNIFNEMKSKLNVYQSKEDVIKDKEAELERLEHSLTAKDRVVGDEMIFRGQVEVLFEKVNKLIVLAGSSVQSESQSQELHFSSSMDKLFYVIDKFSEYQQGIFSLSCEKEDLLLINANHVREIENLKSFVESINTEYQDLELKKWQLNEVTSILEMITQKIAEHYPFEDLKPVTAMGLIQVLERQTIALCVDLENSKSQVHELRGKLQAKDLLVDELLAKVKHHEDSHARIQQPDVKERIVFDSSATTMRQEITEIEEGSVGMSLKNPIPASAHVRTMRKGSNDHLVLSIDPESERLLTAHETDEKGHVFKSLNTSGLIPKQGRLIADRVDGIWVSGGRVLMRKPAARLGLIAYWIFLHLWVLGSIL